MKKHGFTLIELLIVITIIAILAGAAIPYVQQYVEDARYAKAKQDMEEIRNALIRYEADRGTIYAPTQTAATLNELVGPYLTQALIDPWGGAYSINSLASRVICNGPNGALGGGDDVIVDFRPPLALSKVYWEDTNGSGAVSAGDSIILKFTRPVDKTTPADFLSRDNYGYPAAGAFTSGWPAADADFSAVGFSNNDMTVTLTMADTTNIAAGATLFVPGKDSISILNANANKIEDAAGTACKSGATLAVPIKAR